MRKKKCTLPPNAVPYSQRGNGCECKYVTCGPMTSQCPMTTFDCHSNCLRGSSGSRGNRGRTGMTGANGNQGWTGPTGDVGGSGFLYNNTFYRACIDSADVGDITIVLPTSVGATVNYKMNNLLDAAAVTATTSSNNMTGTNFSSTITTTGKYRVSTGFQMYLSSKNALEFMVDGDIMDFVAELVKTSSSVDTIEAVGTFNAAYRSRAVSSQIFKDIDLVAGDEISLSILIDNYTANFPFLADRLNQLVNGAYLSITILEEVRY